MSKIKEKSLLYHAIMSEIENCDIYFYPDGYWSFTIDPKEYPAVKDKTHNIIKPGSKNPRADFEMSCADIEAQLP